MQFWSIEQVRTCVDQQAQYGPIHRPNKQVGLLLEMCIVEGRSNIQFTRSKLTTRRNLIMSYNAQLRIFLHVLNQKCLVSCILILFYFLPLLTKARSEAVEERHSDVD